MAKLSAKQINDKFSKRIHKRGANKVETEEDKPALSPYVIGLFLFVVIGSAVFQILRSATKGNFTSSD